MGLRFVVVGGFGLRELEKVLLPAFARLEDDIAIIFRDWYKRKILEVGAYDTGAFYRSVVRDPNAFLDGGMRVRGVTADTTKTSQGQRDYADIVERGRKPPVNYPGRYPAQLAIDAAEQDIEQAFDRTANGLIEIISGA
jgi:hypothetical protein